MNLLQALNIMTSLFVVCSPFVAVPAMISLTKGHSEYEKKRVALFAACGAAAILVGFAWLGTPLFTLLGIHLYALQIGGGFVVFLLGLAALQSKPEEEVEGRRVAGSVAIVPLAIPVMAGPGAISQVIIAAEEFPGLSNQLCITLAILVVALLLGVCLRFSMLLERWLGVTGLNVASSLGGLLLIAIAVETMVKGIMGYFPGLAS